MSQEVLGPGSGLAFFVTMAFVLAILSCQMAAITHTSTTVRIGEALTESKLVPAQLFSTGASDCLALEAAGKEPLRLIDVMV